VRVGISMHEGREREGERERERERGGGRERERLRSLNSRKRHLSTQENAAVEKFVFYNTACLRLAFDADQSEVTECFRSTEHSSARRC
jgi:hypothetical protein